MIGTRTIPAQAIEPPAAHRLLRAADRVFALWVLAIASDAFTGWGLHGAAWALAYGWLALRLAMLPGAMAGALQANAVFLLYPGLCAVSMLWSAAPLETLRFALQLLATTLIALFIGMRLSTAQIARATGLALLVLMLASLANLGGALADPFDHRGNFTGIFQSKNALGHRSVLFVATAMALILILPGIGMALRLALLAGLAATAQIVAISGSATGIAAALTLGLAAPVIWLARVSAPARGALVAAGCAALAAAILALTLAGVDPVAAAAGLLGRDATLTGRTLLWDLGLEAWAARPLLGHGALGFWQDPANASRLAAVQSFYGAGVLGFHNLAIELLAMLGPAGPILHAAAGIAVARRAGAALRRHADPAAAWALAAVAALYLMAMVGPQLHNPHAIPWILLVATGTALGREARG